MPKPTSPTEHPLLYSARDVEMLIADAEARAVAAETALAALRLGIENELDAARQALVLRYLDVPDQPKPRLTEAELAADPVLGPQMRAADDRWESGDRATISGDEFRRQVEDATADVPDQPNPGGADDE